MNGSSATRRPGRRIVVAAIAAGLVLTTASALHAAPAVPGAPPGATGYAVPAGTLQWANDIDDAGFVVGQAGENGAVFDSAHGTMRPLPVPPGAANTVAQAVNNAHQVAGVASFGGLQRAYRWSPDGTMTDVGGPGFSYAMGINDRGDVVGNKTVAPNINHAFRWTESGGLTDLGTVGALDQSVAHDVDDAGTVVGDVFHVEQGTAPTYHAFVWTAGAGMADIGTLGGAFASAVAVNGRGEVVGTSTTADGVRHLFRWTAAAGMVDLGTAGYGVDAADVNDTGTIVGTWQWWTGEGPSGRAFRWTAGTGFEDLGAPSGDQGVSWANGVNAAGAIVGTTSNDQGDAYAGYLWRAGANPNPPTTATTTTTTPPPSAPPASAVRAEAVYTG